MGKLTHPSQGQELESAGRIPDQTENSISSKKCEKSVLCDGDIYYSCLGHFRHSTKQLSDGPGQSSDLSA